MALAARWPEDWGACTHVCVCMYVCVCVCACVLAYVCAFVCMCARACSESKPEIKERMMAASNVVCLFFSNNCDACYVTISLTSKI